MKEIIEKLTDDELFQLVEELELLAIPEDALIRKIIIEGFGGVNIITLQIQILMPYITFALADRLKFYKNIYIVHD